MLTIFWPQGTLVEALEYYDREVYPFLLDRKDEIMAVVELQYQGKGRCVCERCLEDMDRINPEWRWVLTDSSDIDQLLDTIIGDN